MNQSEVKTSTVLYRCVCGKEFTNLDFARETVHRSYKDEDGEHNYDTTVRKCPSCGALENDTNERGYILRINIRMLYKNVVEVYHYLDTAMDYYMIKITYYDPMSKTFKTAKHIDDNRNYILEDPSPAIVEIWTDYQRAENNRALLVLRLAKTIAENRICPNCEQQMWLVKNTRFLWLLHNKGLCTAPYDHRTIPKGSCREYSFVLFCSNCKVNYSIQNYHRTFTIKMIKDLKELGELMVYSGMEGRQYKLTFPEEEG